MLILRYKASSYLRLLWVACSLLELYCECLLLANFISFQMSEHIEALFLTL